MRAGALETAPDAVAVPRSADEVRAVLGAGVAVVPFGGGTSVVGGVEALRGEHPAVVSLDLGRLDRLLSVDARSRVAVFEPGIQLPAAEAALNAQGFTLGHFPQSYEYATVGGCVATRSAGQASTGYGRIDAMVVGLDVATPAGDVRLPDGPGVGGGPGPARAVRGLGGRAGRADARGAARAAAAGRAPLRGLHVRLVRAGLRGVARARAGGRGAARGAAQRRVGDRGHVRDGGPRGRDGRSGGALPARAQGRARLPGDRAGGRARWTASRTRARRASSVLRAPRRGRPGPLARAARGRARASTGRTCATTCWSAA